MDEGAASAPLRADAVAPSRRADGAAGLVLGRDRHQPAGRASRSSGRRSSAGGSSRRSSGSPTSSCGCAGCPTPSATTATCRRSCSGTGMDWFQTIKLAWNKAQRLPAPQLPLAGIDGSTVLVHMPPGGRLTTRRGRGRQPAHGLEAATPRSRPRTRRCSSTARATAAAARARSTTRSRRREQSLPRTSARRSTPPRATSSAPSSSARRRRTHVGELYLEAHQGTYTTQAHDQEPQPPRRAQAARGRGARGARRATTAAPVLEQHWRDVLLNQFHDILPARRSRAVNREAVETYARIEASTRRLRRRARRRVCPREATGRRR